MNKIKIEKDIIVKDQYGVWRQVWVAGEEVEEYVYYAVMRTNTPINPEDLPIPFAPSQERGTASVAVRGIETKMLVEPESKEEVKVEPKEQEVKAADKKPANKKKSAKPKRG